LALSIRQFPLKVKYIDTLKKTDVEDCNRRAKVSMNRGLLGTPGCGSTEGANSRKEGLRMAHLNPPGLVRLQDPRASTCSFIRHLALKTKDRDDS